MVKDALADTGMDVKSVLKCRNMFALGLVCWLFSRDLDVAFNFLREKFAKKPAIAEANIKVIQAGWDYGHNTHSSTTSVYRVESKVKEPGRYMDITGTRLPPTVSSPQQKKLASVCSSVLILLHLLPMCCTNWLSTSRSA
jgi:2-oxoglutarate ferredoxin oxidoreductase subunit alpha